MAIAILHNILPLPMYCFALRFWLVGMNKAACVLQAAFPTII